MILFKSQTGEYYTPYYIPCIIYLFSTVEFLRTRLLYLTEAPSTAMKLAFTTNIQYNF